MFFETDVLAHMMKKYALLKDFTSSAQSTFPYGSPYSLQSVVFSTVGENGSTAYGFTIGEEHVDRITAKWLRFDYDSIFVNHDGKYKHFFLSMSVGEIVHGLKEFGLSEYEAKAACVLSQMVRIRGSNVL